MDKIFESFKGWIDSTNEKWRKRNVTIHKIEEASHAHQIHVHLQSEVAFGHIGLYESNNIYWVEFEAVTLDYEDFYKHIEFDTLPSFSDLEVEYVNFLTKN